MSSKNIFEVLQNIAENTESNEKFLNILKENGFTGTLEEAENQINQQTQVVLNNLTTEDLQNIAGGKSLMNDKLKKAIAVGGASLMAAGTVVPSSLAANKNDEKKFADSALTYVKKNPVHTGVTTILGLTTAALLVKSIFGGKTVSGPYFADAYHAFLRETDLSDKQDVLKFIDQLSDEACEFELSQDEKTTGTKIKFTKTKDDILNATFIQSGAPKAYKVNELLFALITAMDKGHKYVTNDNKLTDDGANVLNTLAPYIVQQINNIVEAGKATKESEKAKKELEKAKKELEDANTAVTEAKKQANDAEEAKKTAEENKQKADEEATSAAGAQKTAADAAAKEAQEEVTNAEKKAKETKDAVTKAETNATVAQEAVTEAEKKVQAAEDAQGQTGKFNNLKLEMPKLKFKAGDSVKPEANAN